VTRRRSGSGILLALNALAPLPGEVLSLSEQRQQEEDELRWRRLHEGTAQGIIRLFGPDDDQLEVLLTSLERVARQLEVDVESARAGVLNLIAEGDFAANVDVAEGHRVFELAVDWEQFTKSRFGVRVHRLDDDEGA